jgi:hypothetical protein
MFSDELNIKHLIALLIIITILVIVYIIDPFPPVPPSSKEIKTYEKYYGQQFKGRVEKSFIFQGRAHVILTTGEKMRLPWADQINNKFGISDYLENGDSIQIKADTIILIKDKSVLFFKIIE